MQVDVVPLPSELKAKQLTDRVVVVLDVLRATTTIAAALNAGVQQIFIYRDIELVRQAKKWMPEALTCGEQNCLKPEGFDLGNSPDAFGPQHIGETLLMSTTNGTKAILAAYGASRILTGAIVNARAVAMKAKESEKDVTLLCAGTNGAVAMEDLIGAFKVMKYLGETEVPDEPLMMALQSVLGSKGDLRDMLRSTAGGKNIIRAGLEKDIDFAAQQNIFEAVGEVEDGEPIRIVPAR